MKLTSRILLWFIGIYIVIALSVTLITIESARNSVLENTFEQYQEHIRAIDAILSGFFGDIAADLSMLAQDDRILYPDSSEFTNFLEADPSTFTYHYSQEELKIIKLFNTYRLTHPHVNSVYMGREDGSFVRSHPRHVPSQYDPRTRPWYIAALEQPDQIVHTDPYAAVTTMDINIGSVLALRDTQQHVYGVIGIDVTLESLTQLLQSFKLQHSGELVLLDRYDKYILSSDSSKLQTSYFDTGNYINVMTINDLTLEESSQNFRIRVPYDLLTGSILVHIPKEPINNLVFWELISRMAFLSIVIFIVLVVTYMLIQRLILIPLRKMQVVIEASSHLRTPTPIELVAKGEIANFISAYNRLTSLLLQEEMELRQVKLLAINSLTSLVEKRDNETGAHIIRTQKYLDLLATAYVSKYLPPGMTNTTLERWVECAPLHDIGKVGIPDYILLKPGPLTKDEFELMKMHTVYGKETIERGNAGIEDKVFIQAAINIVYSHHERWDGKGYPQGISGEAIPLEARIMAIADVYDALTTKRVYKEAYDHEASVAIIMEGSGTQFDPNLADLFLSLNQSFKMIKDMYRD